MTTPDLEALRAWVSFKELDEALSLPKGSAFRAFKRITGRLQEGTDYVVLTPARDAQLLEALRRSGRIYASSVNPVLLSPPVAAQLRAALHCS